MSFPPEAESLAEINDEIQALNQEVRDLKEHVGGASSALSGAGDAAKKFFDSLGGGASGVNASLGRWLLIVVIAWAALLVLRAILKVVDTANLASAAGNSRRTRKILETVYAVELAAAQVSKRRGARDAAIREP